MGKMGPCTGTLGCRSVEGCLTSRCTGQALTVEDMSAWRAHIGPTIFSH
jgi:hypothetical protein